MKSIQIKPVSNHASQCSDMAITAMRTYKCMDVVYHGEERTVEVHAVGWNAEFQNMMMVWQVRGASRSGQPEGWKFMLMDDVSSFSLSEITSLAPRVGYRVAKLTMRVLESVKSSSVSTRSKRKINGGRR